MLHPISEKFSQHYLWNISDVHLIDNGPLSSFQERPSRAFSFHTLPEFCYSDSIPIRYGSGLSCHLTGTSKDSEDSISVQFDYRRFHRVSVQLVFRRFHSVSAQFVLKRFHHMSLFSLFCSCLCSVCFQKPLPCLCSVCLQKISPCVFVQLVVRVSLLSLFPEVSTMSLLRLFPEVSTMSWFGFVFRRFHHVSLLSLSSENPTTCLLSLSYMCLCSVCLQKIPLCLCSPGGGLPPTRHFPHHIGRRAGPSPAGGEGEQLDGEHHDGVHAPVPHHL